MPCIVHGRRRSSAAGQGRYGCSRHRRRRQPGRSLARGGSRQMIVTARRWCGWCARAPGAPPSRRSSRRCCGTVRHRRQLVDARRVLQQRLHDQLNVLCPGLSAPAGHGRALKLESPTGQAVLACAAAFAGRAPSKRSLLARAPGPHERRDGCVLGRALEAAAWRHPPTPSCARSASERDLRRWQGAAAATSPWPKNSSAVLLAKTAGQILTSLPGVAIVRAAAFSAYTLPIERLARRPSTSTRPPAWRRRAISPRRSPAADGSAAKACPSTATR